MLPKIYGRLKLRYLNKIPPIKNISTAHRDGYDPDWFQHWKTLEKHYTSKGLSKSMIYRKISEIYNISPATVRYYSDDNYYQKQRIREIEKRKGCSVITEYPEKITLETKLEEVPLSVRSHKQLSRLGIKTIGDLVQKTLDELVMTRKFGGKSLNEVKDLLNRYGFNLRGAEYISGLVDCNTYHNIVNKYGGKKLY